MKKKFLALAMVVLIAVSAVSAMGFQLGASWNTGFPYQDVVVDGKELDFKEFFNPEGMMYGPDVRVDLNFLDIGNTFHLTYFPSTQGISYINEVYADINIPIFFIKIGAGMGLQTAVVSPSEKFDPDTFDFLEKSHINYRGTVGFKLGPVELDVQYFLGCPTAVSAAQKDSSRLAEIFTPDVNRSRVGLSVLYSF